MTTIVRQIRVLFAQEKKWRLWVIIAGLMVRAAVETLGVSSIAPFMGVVANPALVETHPWLSAAYDRLGFESVTSFISALGLAVIVVLAVSNSVSALTQWAMLRFAWGTNHRLSVRLLKDYLAQPYGVFVERNSAEFSKTVLSEINAVVNGVVVPALTIVSRVLVVVAISAFLINLDPGLAIVILTVLGGLYGGLYMLIRTKQHRLGRVRADANTSRFKTTNEAFGGIKDVKVLQREGAFVEVFRPASWAFSSATASNSIVSQLPRYLFETIAFGGIVAIVLYFLRAGNGVAEILPIISVYAFAGYRLMPELQNLFLNVSAIRFNRPLLDDVIADLTRFPARPEVYAPLPEGHELRDRVAFDGVTFQYANSDRPALDAVSLEIPKNETVGLVGPSGSGKTTLVDLLLGLYAPDAGQIVVDGVALDAETVRAWKRRVGYVPQQIFLADASIESNVAFGVPPREVDAGRVEAAARQAHLHDFIATLPGGYQTVVGERGVRLSGGQRQRIGIARALYHDPDVLVMDEATSALDNATESAVMEAIGVLAGHKTIVLIAHRLSTVMECDRIYVLEEGRVVDCGTFHELAERNDAFRMEAQLSAAPSA